MDLNKLANYKKLLSGIENLTISNFYQTIDFDDLLRKINVRKLGSGAVGDVYAVENTNLVIKEVEICRSGLLSTYCDFLKEQDSIIKIPHENNYIIMIPNYLNEGLIGGYMGELVELGFTQHVTPVYGTWLDIVTEKAFIVMPKYNPNVISTLTSPLICYSFLFQIMHALYVSQALLEFTHYDLHSGNILCEQNYTRGVFEYDLPFGKFKLKNFGYVYKITDYGLARLKKGNIILNNREDRYPIITGGVYNPSYDVASIIYVFIPILKQNLIPDDIIELLDVVFGSSNPNKVIKKYLKGGWRPKQNIQTRSTLDILLYLAEKIQLMQGSVDSLPTIATFRNPNQALKFDPKISPTFSSIDYIADGVEIEHYRLNNTNFFHVIQVNLQKNKLKPIIDCCKIDLLDYMKDKYGFIINGGFFDIKRSYKPIGKFQMEFNDILWQSNLPIPKDYETDYGIIYIEDGTFKIIPVEDLQSTKPFPKNLLASAPLLKYQGEIFYKKFDDNKYNCKNFPNSNKKFVKINNEDYMNCTRIDPGELSHLGNKNPRSAIYLTYDNKIGFLYIEGRNDRGEGASAMDIVNLLDKRAHTIIGLDGGRSSNIAWRSSKNPEKVFSANPNHLEPYPVGNVLGFVAKK